MTPEPKRINGQWTCQHDVDGKPCGRVMVRTSRHHMACMNTTHGGLFPIPKNVHVPKTRKQPKPVDEWKKSLPIARPIFRRHVRDKEQKLRYSFAVWRIPDDPRAFAMHRMHATETDEIPDGYRVVRYAAFNRFYAAILKPINVPESELKKRGWKIETNEEQANIDTGD